MTGSDTPKPPANPSGPTGYSEKSRDGLAETTCPKCGASQVAQHPVTGEWTCLFCHAHWAATQTKVVTVDDENAARGKDIAEGRVYACPNCGGTDLKQDGYTGKWMCQDCRNEFLDVEARMDAANVLSLLGTTSFTWSELGMQAPSLYKHVKDKAEIEAALQEKAGWILRKLREQRERARRLEAARVDWRDGAAIPFLGEPVIMLLDPRVGGSVLHSAEATLPGVPRLTLHLGLPQDAAPEQIRDAVQGWLQRQARRIFEERVSVFAPRLGVRVKRLVLSAAATRWGSASADGSIRLNWRLVHFGMPVIDYVVTHELAHLLEMNHSPAFWEVVRAALPGFEAARGALRSEVLPVFE